VFVCRKLFDWGLVQLKGGVVRSSAHQILAGMQGKRIWGRLVEKVVLSLQKKKL
jgi:hypothetical protein